MRTTTQVRQFTHYRAFLVAYSQERKSKDPSWSYGLWARKVGLQSTSSITKVIQGERHPGPRLVERLVHYFRFNQRDAAYFKDLVNLAKLQNDPRLAVMILEKIGKQFPDERTRILDDKTFAILAHWYSFPIREMSRMSAFMEDPEWISKKFLFKVGAREVEQAIRNLLGAGLLIRNASGQLTVAEGRVDTRNDFASEAIKRYHEQMLENAKTSLRSIPVEEREFTAATLVLRKENLPKAKQLIREFRARFAELMEEPDGDQVYQVQVQLFPLTQVIKKEMNQ